MKVTEKCIICKGTGSVVRNRKTSEISLRRKTCKLLIDNGYTYQEIQDLLKIKSKSLIAFDLKALEKVVNNGV